MTETTAHEFARMLHWRDQCHWSVIDQRPWCQLRPSEQQYYREEGERLAVKAREAAK